MLRLIVLVASLFCLWLLMSGIYTPMIIGFGLFSAILSTWIVHRLGLLTNTLGFFAALRPVAFIRYLFWLLIEIGKADWAVTMTILSPQLPKDQRLISVPATQKTDLGKSIFANSITITPGTVTVETESDHFIVHALTDEAADLSALAEMDQNVSRMEQ